MCYRAWIKLHFKPKRTYFVVSIDVCFNFQVSLLQSIKNNKLEYRRLIHDFVPRNNNKWTRSNTQLTIISHENIYSNWKKIYIFYLFEISSFFPHNFSSYWTQFKYFILIPITFRMRRIEWIQLENYIYIYLIITLFFVRFSRTEIRLHDSWIERWWKWKIQ